MASNIPLCANEAHVNFAKQFGVISGVGDSLPDLFDSIMRANGYPTPKGWVSARQKRGLLHTAATNTNFGRPWFEHHVFKRFKARAHKDRRIVERDVALSKVLRIRAERLAPLWNFLDDVGVEHAEVIANLPAARFYRTHEWRRFRYLALIAFGSRCAVCGASAHGGAQIEIDHIKPRYLYPELGFHPENIQALCVDCHAAKGMGSDRHVVTKGVMP
ncbi:MAG: HNH endonuclease signature motif containing protein [Paracoccus sp. (in: a-proteobacteria)]|nr:HNH endonuclease signature motif containing protein [Paracoccus sp. (in: a-proteobacteria)]